MKELTTFKNKIFAYGIACSLICQVISFFVLGINGDFTYGLVLGTCVSIVNFNILAITLTLSIERKIIWLVPISYLVRMFIYGFVFYMSAKINLISGIGCVLGFICQKVAIYYIHGFKTKFSTDRKVSPELQAEFDEEERLKEIDNN